MQTQYRNVLVLSGCQATLQITGATMISVTGLAGFALADDKALATVPLTTYVLGSAFTTMPGYYLSPMEREGHVAIRANRAACAPRMGRVMRPFSIR